MQGFCPNSGSPKSQGFFGEKAQPPKKRNFCRLQQNELKGELQRAAAAGVGFAGDQPSAMLALSPKGEYKGVTLRYSVCYHGRKEKGAHTPFTAPYFAFVRLGRVFTRLSACSAHRAFPAAVSAEEEFAVLFLSSAVIYTQWV